MAKLTDPNMSAEIAEAREAYKAYLAHMDESSAPKPVVNAEATQKASDDEYRREHEGDGFIDKVKDPKRWQAILNNTGPYAQEVVAGAPPMVVPGSVVPRLAKAAGALANGSGLGYAAARSALSVGQGAAMSALNSNEGESWKDKLDRAESGAKLSGGIQIAAEALPYVGKLAKVAGAKIASVASGESGKAISTYAKHTDDVNDMIRQSDGDMTTAADQVRTKLSDGIQKTKGGLNSQISKTLEGGKPDLRIDERPIIDALEAAKAKLNPNFKSSAIAEIDEMIAKISSEAKSGRAEGGLSAQGLYEAKQFLNEASKSSYMKDGAIFSRSGEAARAAKTAAGKARDAVRTYTPEISQADQQLSKLHQIESRMNKNLLASGKPDGALFAAGEGNNPRNMATLRELERISGVPVTGEIEKLAAARAFANPSLIPSGATDKVAARMAVGAGLGFMADGKEGALVGGALASPFALKYGINVGNLVRDLTRNVPNFAKLTRENPIAAQAVVQLLDGQLKRANPEKPIPPEAEEFLRQNPRLLDYKKDSGRKPSSELKGEAKWANDGGQKLGLSPEDLEILMGSRQGKQILLDAHRLPPGSKRLQSIMNKINGGK